LIRFAGATKRSCLVRKEKKEERALPFDAAGNGRKRGGGAGGKD